MLYHTAERQAVKYSSAVCMIRQGRGISYADFCAQASQCAEAWKGVAGQKVGVYVKDAITAAVSLAALDSLGCNAFLIGRDVAMGEVLQHAAQYRWIGCVSDQEGMTLPAGIAALDFPNWSSPVATPPLGLAPAKIVLLTSGSTGRPKPVEHTWSSLAAGINRKENGEPARWLLAYDFTRFAGLQVFLQSFLNAGCLIIPASNEISEILELIKHHSISHVSGTPTFWRKLLMCLDHGSWEAWPLKQLTLGGEIATQGLLNALRAVFPEARITHIYATTETGTCFSVKDGQEGFPATWLNNPAGSRRLKIEDGELFIQKAPIAQASQERDWFATGDLVQERNGRVYFLGRKTDIINVGGRKVFPLEVEEQLRKTPCVADLRVHGIKSSIMGELVAADVILKPGINEGVAQGELIKYCREHLPAYSRPQIFNFTTVLPENAAGKIVRQERTSAG